ncbi:MAG: hypothetical protein WC107_06745 [Patescibacteria group bacterium]
MGSINKEWHLAHKMPKNPTETERLEWNREHSRNCTCRPMPESLQKKIDQMGRNILIGLNK